jgi:hypothetical protein
MQEVACCTKTVHSIVKQFATCVHCPKRFVLQHIDGMTMNVKLIKRLLWSYPRGTDRNMKTWQIQVELASSANDSTVVSIPLWPGTSCTFNSAEQINL